jgi:DNA-binding NtrC family response regulator
MILDKKSYMTLQPAPHTRPVLPAARQRVLIVDDESAIHFAYRKLIEPEGFDVDTCENLSEAMAMIRTRPYLAIITDIRLQGTDNEDGIELLHFIRKMQPVARVIIATGYGNEELKQTTQTLGAEHYFEKPVRPSLILTALKALSMAVLSASRMDLVDAC